MAANPEDSDSSSSSSSSDEENSVVEGGKTNEKLSSSSSSSSSDEEQSVGEQLDKEQQSPPTDIDATDGIVTDIDATDDATPATEDYGEADNADSCKVFISRIPQMFNEEAVKRTLEEKFGSESVVEVSIVTEKSEDEGRSGYGGADKRDDKPALKAGGNKDGTPQHRGFGFATFSTEAQRQAAVDAGTARGSLKSSSKRKHTLYIRPVVREEEDENAQCSGNKNICFLWTKFRCPYGEGCKFVHEGEGGCATDTKTGDKTKKKQKCFVFKKTGKCKLGDECQFSHDVTTAKSEAEPTEEDGKCTKVPKDKALRDCINWKNKGKCRKGDKCPFRHDEAVRDKVLHKKKMKEEANNKDKANKDDKVRQTLSIRVFGLNYDTTSEEIRAFFAHCGPIMEVTFPTFEDSGRSKGYCGVLFQSPKAVQKAIELDGSDLQGRWLRIQEGKMYLKKWGEVEKTRDDAMRKDKFGDKYAEEKPVLGEYGQKVKRRKKHGFGD